MTANKQEREATIARMLALKEAGAEVRDLRHLSVELVGRRPGVGAVALVRDGEVIAAVSPAMWIRLYDTGEIVYLMSVAETDRLISELLRSER